MTEINSPFDVFEMDTEAETSGVFINFGVFRVKVARAGGGNQAFRTYVSKKLKPHKHAIDHDMLADEVQEKIAREAYAETVVMGWDTNVAKPTEEPDWKPYILFKNSITGVKEPMEFSKENCIKLFVALPEFFKALQRQAGHVGYFVKEQLEDDIKN